MSVMACDGCGWHIDTDYYVEGFVVLKEKDKNGKPLEAFWCSNCLEKHLDKIIEEE